MGRLLLETGLITEELLANGLARRQRIPLASVKTFRFLNDVVKLLPESAARCVRDLVLEDDGSTSLSWEPTSH